VSPIAETARDVPDGPGAQTAEDRRRVTVPDPAPSAPGAPTGGVAHVLQFYEDDHALVHSIHRWTTDALEAGRAAVVIATRAHLAALAVRLRGEGMDPAALASEGRYVALEAAEALAGLMVEGWPDPGRFAELVVGPIARAARGGRGVQAFGEMVALLALAGRFDAAVHLEELWSAVVRDRRVPVLCAYPMAAFRQDADGEPFRRLCAQHTRVVPAERCTGLHPRDRLRHVGHLQQRENSLEAEAARRRAAETLLSQQEQELVAFLESAVEGLQRVAPDGRVLWANRGLLDLLGYTAPEYVGRHVSEVHVDLEALDGLWRGLMAREAVTDLPAKLRSKDGSVRHVRIHASGHWAEGRLLHTRWFIRDVTEQWQLEQELKAKLEQLAVADRRKDEFLAMLGHELRNPLSALQNALAVADLDASRRGDAFRIARRQADQLGRLVDDLLDVARITRGRIELRTEPVSVARLVEQAVEATRALVERRAHGLAVSLPSPDVLVTGDPTRLEQVLVNLITNAAKYTDPGGRIEVAAAEQGGTVLLRVRDNGIGIPADILPYVFDLFAQAERGLDRAHGGLGIGLTIVRQLVELHGGRVEARSEGRGTGAEILVWLPTRARADAGPPPAPPAADGGRPSGIRVLLVEDHVDVATSLTMVLEALGHRVAVAHDGPGGLAAARAHHPDVMLVDIGLPEMDGYEVARRVRGDPALAGVVLIALTGYGLDQDRQRTRAAGFHHHLVKPVDPEALQDLLLRAAPDRTPAASPLG
jgi:PAS domain S-box-containing protein